MWNHPCSPVGGIICWVVRATETAVCQACLLPWSSWPRLPSWNLGHSGPKPTLPPSFHSKEQKFWSQVPNCCSVKASHMAKPDNVAQGRKQSPPTGIMALSGYVTSSFSSVAQFCPILCDAMDCRQASLSITNSQSLLKFMSIESVMPSNHLILCHPLLLPPSIFPSIKVFSNESVLRIRWAKVLEFQL